MGDLEALCPGECKGMGRNGPYHANTISRMVYVLDINPPSRLGIRHEICGSIWDGGFHPGATISSQISTARWMKDCGMPHRFHYRTCVLGTGTTLCHTWPPVFYLSLFCDNVCLQLRYTNPRQNIGNRCIFLARISMVYRRIPTVFKLGDDVQQF